MSLLSSRYYPEEVQGREPKGGGREEMVKGLLHPTGELVDGGQLTGEFKEGFTLTFPSLSRSGVHRIGRCP